MSISVIKDNSFLLDQIKFAARLSKSGDDEQSDSPANLKSSHKNASAEQKNATVSEKVNEQLPFTDYNFRLRTDVPLSKPEKSEKPFNDSKKKRTVEVEDQETGELLDSELVEEEKIKEDTTGKGFYMNAGSSNPAKKRTKSIAELFQERIDRIYNIGFNREPGTLVNLVF